MRDRGAIRARRRRSMLASTLSVVTGSLLLLAPQLATARPGTAPVEPHDVVPAPILSLAGTALPGGPIPALPALSPTISRAGITPWSAPRPYAAASNFGVATSERGARSGLPWASGASCGGPGFERFRGRRQDVQVAFAPFSNWASMVSYFTKGNPAKLAGNGIPVSIGLGLLTQQTRGQLPACASGAFDGYFHQIGASLRGQGQGNAGIRLGWEANGDSFPWVIGQAPDAFKACFRRIAGILHEEAPGLDIEWHNARKGKLGFSNTTAYPGDDVVGDVALSYYDRTKASLTQGDWKSNYSLTKGGGPAGLGPWLAFARAHGKKLTISEWAVSARVYDGFDNALYIQNMHDFFAANAGSIGYEAYFNCPQDGNAYQLYPGGANPNASAKYKSLWGAGGAGR